MQEMPITTATPPAAGHASAGLRNGSRDRPPARRPHRQTASPFAAARQHASAKQHSFAQRAGSAAPRVLQCLQRARRQRNVAQRRSTSIPLQTLLSDPSSTLAAWSMRMPDAVCRAEAPTIDR